MKKYMAWNVEFYDCKFRFWPHDHEVHGPFVARDETDLKAQMITLGLDPQKLRWEQRERQPPHKDNG